MKKGFLIFLALLTGGGAGYLAHLLGGDVFAIIAAGGVGFLAGLIYFLSLEHPQKDGGDGAGRKVIILVVFTVVGGLTAYWIPPPLQWWGFVVLGLHSILGLEAVGLTTRFGKPPGTSTVIARDGGAVSGNIRLILIADFVSLGFAIMFQLEVSGITNFF